MTAPRCALQGSDKLHLLHKTIEVAKHELRLFGRFPRLRISVLGIVLIPALYAYIYIQSVWDPASRTVDLSAAIVNLDRGATVHGTFVNIGDGLQHRLKESGTFGFYDAASADEAKARVRHGHSLFALIIPERFSEAAANAASAGAGKLIIFTSEGNNYMGAGIAKRFATEVAYKANETLNEARWKVVLQNIARSSTDLERLRDGVAQLKTGANALDAGIGEARDGSRQLDAGAHRLSGGVTLLANGVKQLRDGTRLLESKSPSSADLQTIKAGAQQLAAGHVTLQEGLVKLDDGAQQLAQGSALLRDSTRPIPIVGGKIADGANRLFDGATRLESGLNQAKQGTARLAEGSHRLSDGVTRLADGFGAYASGVWLIASKFPDDAKLDPLPAGSERLSNGADALTHGLDRLKDGSAQLARGIETLQNALPMDVPALPGTASGLASSISPDVEIDAPVRNNGTGFAPNFIPVALWLGAVLTTFVFYLRRLPRDVEQHPRVALLLGKLFLLCCINLAQAACILAMTRLMLDMQPVSAVGFAVTVIVTGLTFQLIILFLILAFGDFGRAAGLILLILQLSAAGGIIPIELTSGFYRAISPMLPFTWAVKAIRASAFGAFSGDWQTGVGIVLLFAVGALVLAFFAGRWKFAEAEHYRPALDI